MNKKILKYLLAAFLVTSVASCEDFQDINKDPNAVDEEAVQVDYLLSRSIFQAQQNPHIAERVFILYWDRVSGYEARVGLSLFSDSDSWNVDYYGIGYLSGWLRDATLAVNIGKERNELETTSIDEKNVYQYARIWRAYLLSEMVDAFGPASISDYDGVIPSEMTSVQGVYDIILSELAEAANAIDVSVTPTGTQQANDPLFAAAPARWVKYANSLSLRYAMRVGNQSAFETAASNSLITEQADIAGVLEMGGWDCATAVMSRSWNIQQLSRVMASVSMGLGGVTADQIAGLSNTALSGISVADLAANVKDPNTYLGIRMTNYLPTSTNRDDAGYFFDGIPSVIDPRTMINYSVPGCDASGVMTYSGCAETISLGLATEASSNSDALVIPTDSPITVNFKAKYTYHSLIPGDAYEYGSNFTDFTNTTAAIPAKSAKHRSQGSDHDRIFFGPWETYFLLAEGALKGWNAGMSAKDAYEAGISASFAHNNISSLYDAYITSESYNRNGTSVSFDHTAEISSTDMEYYDFDTNLETVSATEKNIKANPTMETVAYNYPQGAYTTNNDLLTKIITQKYIANCPWLPNEAWSDYRRLNLPFMENPIVEKTFTTMPWYSKANCKDFLKENVPHRLKYPSSINTSNPAAYASGVSLLGGADEIYTPLSWAKK